MRQNMPDLRNQKNWMSKGTDDFPHRKTLLLFTLTILHHAQQHFSFLNVPS